MSKDPWSPNEYDKNASFVPLLGSAILDALDPQPGERILDLGCGNGVLTKVLASRCGSVVGIDASPEMINTASSSSSSSDANIEYHVVDGHHLQSWFDATQQHPFDAVFSNAGKFFFSYDFDSIDFLSLTRNSPPLAQGTRQGDPRDPSRPEARRTLCR